VNQVRPKSLKKSIIIASVIFVVDAFVINQGVIALIFIFAVFLAFLPKAIYLHIKKKSPRLQLYKCVIYTVMAVLILVSNYTNNQIARSRAERLIVAIEEFNIDNNTFPSDLKELVPRYMDSVPNAKFTFGMNKFRYFNIDGNTTLFYVHCPPFGRPTYNFTTKKWGYVD
jgi:predicted PurR-regulated permease PerM